MTTALIPTTNLVKAAHGQYCRLVRLGSDIEEKHREQLAILHWFWREPRRYQALGYDSFEELFCQEDVQRALGLTAESQGARSKLYGLFKISAILPEADVLGPGRSKVAAALPELRPLADAILEGGTPEEVEEMRRELWTEVEQYRSQPLREVEQRVQKRREPPYRLTTENGRPAIGKVDDETGELEIVLVKGDDCDLIGFAALARRLTRSYDGLLFDDDGFWTTPGNGLLRPAARWAHNGFSQEEKQAIAEACRAERRI